MAAGGFDVVLGNPPWEVMQLDEEEYFAQRLPEIAELAGMARKRAIRALEKEHPAAFATYQADKRGFEAINEFARGSGRFDLTARGKVNTYALFAELFASLVSPRGRAGVIVPTGIATDASTAKFFGTLLLERRLFSLHDFQTGQGFFDRIGHARFKFCLLTVGQPGANPEEVKFSFFSRTKDEFADPRRHFSLSREAIALINPNTTTVPVFRTKTDADLTAAIHRRVPVLIDKGKGEAGNPWGIEFRQGLFNMTSDSGLFRTAAQLHAAGFVRDSSNNWAMPQGFAPRQGALALACGHDDRSFALLSGAPGRGSERYVPLFEAKMVHHFDHRWATYDAGATGDDASRAPTMGEMRDPSFEPSPRYWVSEREVAHLLSAKGWSRLWLTGWRDITNATNERTVIAAVFTRIGVGNNLPLMFFNSQIDARSVAAFIGCLSSLTCDFFARHKVGGTHLNFFIYQQIAVLPPHSFTETDLAFVVPRVLELTYTSYSMAPFARDLGYEGPPFAWDENRRAHLRAELDAWYARAYGLTRDELRYILDPADVKGPDYPSETFRVLKKNEVARFSEYRTARLVLAAYDQLTKHPARTPLRESLARKPIRGKLFTLEFHCHRGASTRASGNRWTQAG